MITSTEYLDRYGFVVMYDDSSDTWTIFDSIDEDGFYKTRISHADKVQEIENVATMIREKYLD